MDFFTYPCWWANEMKATAYNTSDTASYKWDDRLQSYSLEITVPK